MREDSEISWMPVFDPAGIMSRAAQEPKTEEDWVQRFVDALVTVHNDGISRLELSSEYFVEKATTLASGIKKAGESRIHDASCEVKRIYFALQKSQPPETDELSAMLLELYAILVPKEGK